MFKIVQEVSINEENFKIREHEPFGVRTKSFSTAYKNIPDERTSVLILEKTKEKVIEKLNKISKKQKIYAK